ncbi:hypothetical protein B0H13DRAFT_1636257 [Mycena leptocephala]|nr:hypothetical protein B0H13DRAFT_1636257 [Mycena leptocephala]
MPATCSICLESFTSPVSLPCGHVFCRECIRRTVDSVKSYNVQHFCPTCRAPYSILTVDPALIPPYLRPHILPPIRQVFFDNPSPTATAALGPAPPSSSSSSTVTPSPTAPGPSGGLARAAEDAATLRLHCETWKRRAELHAAANTNLLGFARAVKDCALRLRAERDVERNQCVILKRKLAELMCVFFSP